MSSNELRIGVLALQGDVREHLAILGQIGVAATEVKTRSQLAEVDGLVLPGGESTTIQKLCEIFDLFQPISDRIKSGMPVFGTCAGLILLANQIDGGIEGQRGFGGLDVTVQRNAFGHQVDSFETDLEFAGIDNKVAATFIRAPKVTRVGSGVSVMATLEDGTVVAVRQDNLLGISFHPEINGETRIHEFFKQMVLDAKN